MPRKLKGGPCSSHHFAIIHGGKLLFSTDVLFLWFGKQCLFLHGNDNLHCLCQTMWRYNNSPSIGDQIPPSWCSKLIVCA